MVGIDFKQELREAVARAKRAKASHDFDFEFKCKRCGYYLSADTDPILSCDEVVIKDILE